MSKVSFSYADRRFSYSNKTALKLFIPVIFNDNQRELNTLKYVFCSDEYLLTINKQFLQHNSYTDIITFELSDNKTTIGEVYISIDRVKENAKDLNNTFEDEILRVIVHGALHLCGYKDKNKSEIGFMRNQEAYYMRLYKQSLFQL